MFLNEELSEDEFIGKIKEIILKKAKQVKFNIDTKQLEAVAFEAYDWDMPFEKALIRVWNAVYVEEGESLEGVTE